MFCSINVPKNGKMYNLILKTTQARSTLKYNKNYLFNLNKASSIYNVHYPISNIIFGFRFRWTYHTFFWPVFFFFLNIALFSI